MRAAGVPGRGAQEPRAQKGIRRVLSFSHLNPWEGQFKKFQRSKRMRILTIALAITTAAVVQTAAYSQDWADDLTNAPRVLAPESVPANLSPLTMSGARSLIENTLQVQDAPTVHYVDDPNFFCII